MKMNSFFSRFVRTDGLVFVFFCFYHSATDMITTYFRSIKNKKLSRRGSFRAGVWVHVQEPTGKEIDHVCALLGLNENLLRDALDPHEVPRVEVQGNITYVFARVPQAHEGVDIDTVPILIALGETFILTVSSQHVAFLDRFTSGALEFYTTQKVKLFIQFFTAITAVYNRRLTLIAKRVRAMNATDMADNRDIVNFVETERVLNDYLSALTPTRRVLRRLLSGNVKRLQFHATDENLVEDLLIDIEQLEEMCHATLKHLVGIRTAHATVATNNLNNTIKMLAALTVILTIPTIIASFFGMNINVPLSDVPFAFAWVVSGTMFFMLLTLWVFRRNRWL